MICHLDCLHFQSENAAAGFQHFAHCYQVCTLDYMYYCTIVSTIGYCTIVTRFVPLTLYMYRTIMLIAMIVIFQLWLLKFVHRGNTKKNNKKKIPQWTNFSTVWYATPAERMKQAPQLLFKATY